MFWCNRVERCLAVCPAGGQEDGEPSAVRGHCCTTRVFSVVIIKGCWRSCGGRRLDKFSLVWFSDSGLSERSVFDCQHLTMRWYSVLVLIIHFKHKHIITFILV